MTYDVEHLFICLFSICISSLARCLLRSLAHFFLSQDVYSYYRVLMLLCIFYLMSFANTFSQSVACLLSLLTVSFAEQKFLVFMKPSLSIVSFMDRTSGVVSKKSSVDPRSFRFSLMLPSKSFIILHITFRSLIHFELIFVKGIRSVSRFVFLHVDVQFFNQLLLTELS